MRSKIDTNTPRFEDTTCCDSMWACLLDDYEIEENHSIRSDTEQDIEDKLKSRRLRKERERRRSSRYSRTTRSEGRDAERSSPSHSKFSRGQSTRSRSRKEKRIEAEEVSIREDREKSFDDMEIIFAPSSEIIMHQSTHESRDPDESDSESRKDNNGSYGKEKSPSKKVVRSKEQSKPENLPTDGREMESAPEKVTKSPRESPRRSRTSTERQGPVLKRSIKTKPPKVLSSPKARRRKSLGPEDSPEFNSIEEYQKSVLRSRQQSKRRLALQRIRTIRTQAVAIEDP